MTLLHMIDWTAQPVIFSIGKFSVRWYGLLFAVGFLVGYQIMSHIYKKEKMPEADLDSLMLHMVLATVIGARIGHFVFYEWEMFLDKPLAWFIEMILPPYEGLASHGAIASIIFALWLYARGKKQHFFWVADRIVITVAFAGFCIRMGNLMNHEIVGKQTDVPWGFRFMNFRQDFEGHLVGIPEGFARHPAQLYEALSCLVLCAILFSIWKKYQANLWNGTLVGIFMVWVFGLRFFYEYLKEVQERFEEGLPLDMGQMLSIPAVLIGVFFLIRAFSKRESGAYV